MLSKEAICEWLRGSQTQEVYVHEVLDSTNLELKRLAREGEKPGTVVLAEAQMAGRGRLGREFYSPKENGIYMSVLVRPELDVSDLVLLTTATSVAVCRGIDKLYDVNPKIKWVNDIYLSNRKVCGILAEAVTNPDTGKIDGVVVGIGVNLRRQEFPDELREIATSIEEQQSGKEVSRSALVAAILDEFWGIYEHLTERLFMEEYRQRSNVIGNEVRFLENETWQEARAIDIDENGGLVVEYARGDGGKQKRTLHTGEITLRVK
nr:biotin--[acetyl-CoA-carboxylase] ligase [Eubacterium sp.]